MKLLSLAEQYVKEGEVQRAQDLILRYRLFPGQTAEEYHRWGKLCEEVLLPQQALECYQKALSVDSSHLPTLLSLASLLYEIGDLDQAKRAAQRLLCWDPQNEKAKELLARIYEELDEEGSREVVAPTPRQEHKSGPRFFPRQFGRRELEAVEEFIYGRKAHGEITLDFITGESLFFFFERPLHLKDLRQHFKGKRYLLAYPISEEMKVRWAAFSLLIPKKEVARRIRDQAWLKHKGETLLWLATRSYRQILSVGLSAALEVLSPFHYRLLFLFAEPIHFLWAKRFLKSLIQHLPYPEEGTVYRPYTFTKAEVAGWREAAIPLPLGRHPATKVWAFLIDEEGTPLEDPFGILKKMRRLSFREVKDFCRRRELTWKPPKEEHPLLSRLNQACPLIRALCEKARAGRSLTRPEKLALFLTVGLLDEDGRLLHELLYATPDYRYHRVEKQRKALPPNPISCYKLREWFPYLASLHLCACPFEETGRYPSPLLHVKPELVGPVEEVSLKTKRPEELARYYEGLLEEKKSLESRLERVERELKTYFSRHPGRKIRLPSGGSLYLKGETLVRDYS